MTLGPFRRQAYAKLWVQLVIEVLAHLTAWKNRVILIYEYCKRMQWWLTPKDENDACTSVRDSEILIHVVVALREDIQASILEHNWLKEMGVLQSLYAKAVNPNIHARILDKIEWSYMVRSARAGSNFHTMAFDSHKLCSRNI